MDIEPYRVRMCLYYQEPFVPIEYELEFLREAVQPDLSFCRYAFVVSEINDKSYRNIYSFLEYPCRFIPYIIRSLYADKVRGLWIIIKSPMKFQINAFKGSQVFGNILPLRQITNTIVPEFTVLMASFVKQPIDAENIADQIGWPFREHWWYVLGFKNLSGNLNNQLLQVIQDMDYLLSKETDLEHALDGEFFGLNPPHELAKYPETLHRLFMDELYFIFTMDNIRRFGPFLYTAEVVKETLAEAIRKFLSKRGDLTGDPNEEVEFDQQQLASFDPWR